jgi:rubrerythrin
MSGRGETPEDETDIDEAYQLDFGETLYNEAGEPVGQIRGLEEGGAYITTREGAEALSVQHARSGHTFGEAELMWRCTECGEMDYIDEGIPETCPSCGTGKENLFYWTED